jgi:hypothetical protein
MSWPWFKNFVGVTLTDEEMRKIPRPTTELTIHVTMKTVQAFGLLGTCVVGPLSAVLSSSTRNVVGIKSNALKYGKWGVVLGVVAGPLMTYGRLTSSKADETAVYDRCYRLRYNYGQVRVDRASIVGAVGGSVLAIPAGTCPILGALLGMSAGVVSMAFYNNTGSK